MIQVERRFVVFLSGILLGNGNSCLCFGCGLSGCDGGAGRGGRRNLLDPSSVCEWAASVAEAPSYGAEQSRVWARAPTASAVSCLVAAVLNGRGSYLVSRLFHSFFCSFHPASWKEENPLKTLKQTGDSSHSVLVEFVGV